jgi:hypothetical protein
MKEDWKSKAYLTGGILGCLIGILAAFLMVRKAEQQNSQPRLDAGDGVKVGLGVLTLLKLIVDTGTD